MALKTQTYLHEGLMKIKTLILMPQGQKSYSHSDWIALSINERRFIFMLILTCLSCV